MPGCCDAVRSVECGHGPGPQLGTEDPAFTSPCCHELMAVRLRWSQLEQDRWSRGGQQEKRTKDETHRNTGP